MATDYSSVHNLRNQVFLPRNVDFFLFFYPKNIVGHYIYILIHVSEFFSGVSMYFNKLKGSDSF